MWRCDFSASALHFAARRNSCKDIEILLQLSADLNNRNHRGRTPLHIAAEFRSWKAFGLLSKHSDLDAADSDGDNILEEVIDAKNVDMVQLLLESGADANAALFCAVDRVVHHISLQPRPDVHHYQRVGLERSRKAAWKIFQLLLVHVTNFKTYEFYASLLDLACGLKYERDVAALLMQHGAVPTISDERTLVQFSDDAHIDLVRMACNNQHEFDEIRRELSKLVNNHTTQEFSYSKFLTPSQRTLDVEGTPIAVRQTLQEACCGVIRQQVRKPLWKGIATLPLPKILQQFLKLEHLV